MPRIRKIDEFNPGRLRLPRLCQARRTLPTADGHHSMVFTCNLLKGHDTNGMHVEDGRVRSRNGQVATYTFSWADEGRQLWRQEGRPAVVIDDAT